MNEIINELMSGISTLTPVRGMIFCNEETGDYVNILDVRELIKKAYIKGVDETLSLISLSNERDSI